MRYRDLKTEGMLTVKGDDGSQATYWGVLHNPNAPAKIGKNREYWYLHGKLHRENGPAMTLEGRKYWCIDGEYHREDGPAIIYPAGRQEYYYKGKLHRENGPAIIDNSKQLKEYYIHGEKTM